MADETQRTVVIQKEERDRNRICTLYGATEPTKFILETCDGIISTIKNMDKKLIGVLTEETPITIILGRGYYEVCVIGEGTGTVYAIPYAENNVDPEDCCDELRARDEDLQNQINNLRVRIQNLENIVNNLSDNDCCEELRTEIDNLRTRILRLERNSGEACCEELRTEINNIEGDITNILNRLNNLNIVGGTDISVQKNGDVYTINYTGTGGSGSTECCEEITQRINNLSINGGTGISVQKNGDNYTIVNTLPAGGDSDTNTVTTILPGTGVTVTDAGTNGNHVYTITATGGSGSTECCEEITQRINNLNINGGTGISVTKNGDNYTIVNTLPAGGDNDSNTVTTILPGTGVSITDAGTNGNHVYTITATSSGNTECCDQINDRIDNITIQGGTGISVTKQGDNYTIVNTSPDTGDTNTVTTITAGDNISIVDNGTGGNHNYTITATGGSGSTECCDQINDRIDNITIQGGTGISVTKNGDNYTITNTSPASSITVPNAVEVVSVSPNIIVTKRVV